MEPLEVEKLPESEEEIQKLVDEYKEREALTAPPNRAMRRRKPLKPRFTIVDYVNVPSNILTKATHKYKKIRKENAIKREKRRGAAKRARKANKESNTEVS